MISKANFLRPCLILNYSFKTYSINTSEQASVKPFESIPGPKSYPLIENLLSLKKYGGDIDPTNVIEFHSQLYEKYGNIVKYGVMSKPELYVFSPEILKKVFQLNDKYPIRKPFVPTEMYMKLRNRPRSLASSYGEHWRTLRTASNPMMTKPYIIHSYIGMNDQIINDCVKYLNLKFNDGGESGIVIERFDDTLKYLIFELISSVAFDKKIDCVDENLRTNKEDEFIKFLDDWVETITVLMTSPLPLWKYLPTNDWKKFVEVSDGFFRSTDEYMDTALSDLKRRLAAKKSDEEPRTILQHLYNSKEKYNMTDADIKSIMAEVFQAGVDTTATSFNFVFYELGRNPKFQDELYNHILEHYKPGDELTYEHLENMNLLKATVKEALRLHGVVTVLGRQLQEDTILDGYQVPKGTYVNVFPYVTGRSTAYFENPTKFDPHRWINPKNKIHPFISIWFGFGSRGCVGKKLAEQQMHMILLKVVFWLNLRNFVKLMISKLQFKIFKFVLNYKFEYVGQDIVKYKTKFNLMPDSPLKLKLTKRK